MLATKHPSICETGSSRSGLIPDADVSRAERELRLVFQ